MKPLPHISEKYNFVFLRNILIYVAFPRRREKMPNRRLKGSRISISFFFLFPMGLKRELAK